MKTWRWRLVLQLGFLLVAAGAKPATGQPQAAVSARPATAQLAAPGGHLVVRLALTSQALTYEVRLDGQTLVLLSALGLAFEGAAPLGPGLVLARAQRRRFDEYYPLPVGKASRVHHHCRELAWTLCERAAPGRRLVLRVRAYDDGVAFRYELPAQPGWRSYVLTAENSTFRLAGDPQARALLREGYLTSHEGFYSHLPLSHARPDTLLDLLALFEYPGRAYVAVTEAAVRDYATLYLARRPADGVLTSRLSPLPGQAAVKVRATLPHRTPWRVLLVGRRAGTLLESNLLTSPNEPSALPDLRWLRPGLSTFPWWNGDVLPDTTFAPGLNFDFHKYYIDFCARQGLAYHTVIGYGGVAWYQNDGESYQPGPHSDVTRPVPGLDMARICQYAARQGVGVRVWVHWQPFYARLDSAVAQFERWGVRGMMVDFMDRDDQQMVNMQEEILRKSAQHHLHVQFHGVAKPSGLSRTYPNELTREAAYNYENDKWAGPVGADHDLDIVFTRLLAGPTDYHLGGFRAATADKFRSRQVRPLVGSTRAHMLAMYVVLESYLGLVCDEPTAYENQPGFEFIRALPTVWDETRAPLAEPGQYACVARRKGTDWFVGALTNHAARTLTLPLSFLPPGHYEAHIFADAPDAATQPNHLQRETRDLTSRDTLTLDLAASGGQAVLLRRISPR